jgi:hypothetical protein
MNKNLLAFLFPKSTFFPLIFIGFLSIATYSGAQETVSMKSREDSLVRLSASIWKLKDDSLKMAANSLFHSKFTSALQQTSAFEYPFDSLAGISKLISDDGLIRIFTWNVPMKDGSSSYFGFILLKGGQLYVLKENHESPGEWENKIMKYDNWYGAIYYKLITTEFNKEKFYTLLGWDSNNESSNLKVIDVLSFDNAGIPVFGKPIFKTTSGIKNRITIEYAKKASDLLRYDYQTLLITKGRKIKEKKTWMIVTDRMIPMVPTMEGIRKYYVPSGDTYDAYLFNNGCWTFVEDIKVGNIVVRE